MAVHLPSNINFQALLLQVARTRHPCGTRINFLSAASVRIWHGSKASVAQDPIVNAPYKSQTSQAKP